MAILKVKARWILLLVVIILVGMFLAFGLQRFLDFEYLRNQHTLFQSYYAENKLKTIVIYFLIYILTTALSLPGAVVLTLAGGAIFGLLLGTIVISFASSIGATGAFLVARYIFRDWVQIKFGSRLSIINKGFHNQGAFYLFALRLVPLFPFFLINLLMGLTPIKTWTFYWVSQLGMLAGTIVYVNAGTQLGQIQSLSDIISMKIIAAFVILGIFPFLAKKLLGYVKTN